MTMARAPVHIETQFVFGAPIKESELNLASGMAYITGGAVNARAITSALQGVFEMSRNFATGIAPEFKSGLDRHDLTTMFVISHLIEHNLYTCEMRKLTNL